MSHQNRKTQRQSSNPANPSRTKSQLLYRPSFVKRKSITIIRSEKTADLLHLDRNSGLNADIMSCATSIQPGGFIRSRLTAELLGIKI